MDNARHATMRGHYDGVDSWRMILAAPAPALAGRIGQYADYRERIGSFTTRRELAATGGVLIFVLGDPLEIVGADGTAITIRRGEAFVGGIADATSLSRGRGEQAGVQISLSLLGLAAICGAPVAELANRVALLTDLVGDRAREIGSRLVEAADAEARFALLDGFLAGRFRDAAPAEPRLVQAMDQLAAADAPASSRIAGELGWSRKHFASRFRAATGFSPDRFRRLARFERFVTALRAAPGAAMAGLAADAGYADQPHLIRDVRDFSDMTPGELRARLVPDGGGVRDDQVTSVQSAAAPSR